MKIQCLTLLSIVTIAGPAVSMDFQLQQRASGLALIMAAEQPCRYAINQDALDKYFATSKFDQPEILSFINNSVVVKKATGEFDSATCTIARRTAASAGLLAK